MYILARLDSCNLTSRCNRWFPLSSILPSSQYESAIGTCVSESVRLQSSKGVRWEYENGLHLSRNFANMSTATSVRDNKTLQPEGTYYRSLGHGTTSHRNDCGRAHFLQPTMPDIDIQSQSQSVRFFHYLEAIAATFLLFALLVDGPPNEQSGSLGAALIVMIAKIPKEHVSTYKRSSI